MHCGMLENIELIGNNIIAGNRGKEFRKIRK